MRTHYQPVENGYEIVGSRSKFNRTLYGGHANDDKSERFITMAGDRPVVMGALTDWRTRPDCTLAKCGVFMAGVAMTPGLRVPVFRHAGENGGERYGQWLHDSEGTVSTLCNGWMEHRVWPFFQCFPRVEAFIEVLPLMPMDGFLVRVRVSTEQHVHFCMGLGAITDFLGRLEFPYNKHREFIPDNCRGNQVTCGRNRAMLTGSQGPAGESALWIGTSFPVDVSAGDARRVPGGPGEFLARDSDGGDTPMVRLSCEIGAGETLDGVVVVVRNEPESQLDRLLAEADPAENLKREIRGMQSAIEISTPDAMLDLTVPPTVSALDGAWHGDSFYHGTFSWHAPYMGWRTSYGATVIGWHERAAQAFAAHAATQVIEAEGPETVEYTGPDQCHSVRNSRGHIPAMLDGNTDVFYNMQEVAVDMFLHHLEWTGDMSAAEEMFDVVARVLDWEQRLLDADGDGLYQNWLNTWISDAHSYNGGACAQASAYNYRANRIMARLAERLGRDAEPFASRAGKTRQAMQEALWQPDKGVMAEYVDTVGNRLVHASPELATAYHTIECGVVDAFQAYQMLRFTETDIRNERTIARGGRLVWSSNWYPQNYSSCGLYPAENIHLAWAYFRTGLTEKGWEILSALAEAHFQGNTPGQIAHCMTPSGYSEGASDFTDVTSMYLRLVVEGLFGVRFDLPAGQVEIAPNLPGEWAQASLCVPDVDVRYERNGCEEVLIVRCDAPARRTIKLPLRSAALESVTLQGQPVQYRTEAGIGRCSVVVETDESGALELRIRHGQAEVPAIVFDGEVTEGQAIRIRVQGGRLVEAQDPSGAIRDMTVSGDSVSGQAVRAGTPTVFVRVQRDRWDGWLPADLTIAAQHQPALAEPAGEFRPVDISAHFNVALSQIHQQEYRQPRPTAYSIGARLNGRFGWDWNHAGHAEIVIDDSALRNCGETFQSPSGVPFFTPASGPNVACVAVWENFPTEVTVPLEGRASELAVFFIGVTNPMQSRVENGRFVVAYADGSSEGVSLVNPVNFDDWLVAAVQQENETVYFGDYNHGIVQRIVLDPSRELQSFTARSTANEVIVGILGMCLRRDE